MQYHRRITLVGLFVLLVISVVITLSLGVSGFSLWSMDSDTIQNVIYNVRLPRILGAILVGMGLATTGCIMQGLFQNPMADPYILGTASGSALGAVCAMLFLGSEYIPIFAFCGAIISIFVVYTISVNHHHNIETLLLSGIAVSLFLSALLSLLMYSFGNQNWNNIMFWVMGGLSDIGWDDIKLGLFIPVLCLIMWIYSRNLNIMTLGSESATHLGVDVEQTKRILLFISACIIGISVSISGCIGFIGLIIPHIMRIFVGSNNWVLLPSSMVAGSILLIWADTMARSLPGGQIPVGIITAFLGAPFFIYLLRTRAIK
ncbi:MAG TPA: iron chelate uptake ABC transporter family permease subunit [Methanocorpusculum sp.]|nr:iron chelate uptake ABC transporter family permease subunit [Methanocorpusculum sp.]